MAGNASTPDQRPEKNFKLVVEYDGTAYCGWQRQPDQASIQGTLESVLQRMTGAPVTLHGSGRTDAGVHALGQTAHFKSRTRLEPAELQKGMNGLLPGDIAVRACQPVPLDFHARFDSRWKRYRYRICNLPVRRAVGRQYVWHIPTPLDLPSMQAAAALLLGTHDFKTFEGSGSPRAHTRRRVRQAAFQRDITGLLIFEIAADGFLRYMVRNIVGTLADVGRGKVSAGRFGEILAARDRLQAGVTAPPQGLFLKQVDYDPASFRLP